MFGGRTNTAWKGECGSEAFVAKLYSGPARNPLFPNDPDAERRLLLALADGGNTPVFRAQLQTESGVCNLYDHIPGEIWRDGVTDVARLMADLHAHPCPEGLRTVPDGSDALLKQGQEILSKSSDSPTLEALKPLGHVPASNLRRLLHSDIVPGNLIRNTSGLFLIDWQCPATGDPCEDIAVFLSPAMQFLYRGAPLTEEQIAAFFDAYGHPETATRYRALTPFFHWRMATYCHWQTDNGRTDYGAALTLELEALQRSLNSNPT
ncbi:phosphotransferase family enzyme [Shimia isoporae]|uniref:Phosphotransferase family enzyme n=1 Tax=Shimia isoporae TaxID=647720 RepID=A0A4R1NCS2_9RHOB|nr:phosphotransferase family enzyme [Shimia isoporae]